MSQALAPVCRGHPDCVGTRVEGHENCLAHLGSAMLQFYLQHLSPGSDLDLRRTTLNADLVNRLLDAAPVLGTVNLAGAVFDGEVEFRRLAAHRLTLDGARFNRHVQIEVHTDWLTCVGTRFEDGATMRAGHGVIVAERTVFGAASSIASGYFQPADHEDAAFKKQWDDASVV